MANTGSDSNITIGVGLNMDAVYKAHWPGDYSVHIKQEVDSSGLKKAVFLGDYVQNVTQHFERDSSWKNLIMIGDHTATTHMVLDDRPYKAALASLPSGNNVMTSTMYLQAKGMGEVLAAYNLFMSLPSEYKVDGKFNGKEVKAELQNMLNTCKNMSDVFNYLDRAMQSGDQTARKFASALSTVKSMGMNVTNLESKMNGMRRSLGNEAMSFVSGNKNWQNLNAVIGEGQRAMASGDYSRMFGWQAQYKEYNNAAKVMEGDVKNIVKEQNAAAKERAAQALADKRRDEEKIRNLEAIERAYKNVSRAIADIPKKAALKGVDEPTKQIDALKKAQQYLAMSKDGRSGLYMKYALHKINLGDYDDLVKRAYDQLGYSVTAKSNIKASNKKTLAAEVADERYNSTIQGLRNSAASASTSIDILERKGGYVGWLKEKLVEVNAEIEKLVGLMRQTDRISGVTGVKKRLNELGNELRNQNSIISEQRQNDARNERNSSKEERREKTRLSNLEAIEKAYNNISRAIERAERISKLTGVKIDKVNMDALKTSKSELYKFIDPNDTYSRFSRVSINEAMHNIRRGEYARQTQRLFDDMGFDTSKGKKQKKEDERVLGKAVSDAQYESTLQRLRNSANSTKTSLDIIANKGTDVSALRKSLKDINDEIERMAKVSDKAARITGVSGVNKMLSDLNNEVRFKRTESTAYDAEYRKEEREKEKRLNEIAQYRRKLENAYINAGKRGGVTEKMTEAYEDGLKALNSAKQHNNTDFYLGLAKKEITDTINLLEEERRKTEAVTAATKKLKDEQERAASRKIATEGVLAGAKNVIEGNKNAKNLSETIRGLNTAMKKATESSDGKHAGKTFKEYLQESKNATKSLSAYKKAFKELSTQIRLAEEQLASFDSKQRKGVSSEAFTRARQELDALITRLKEVRANGNLHELIQARSDAYVGWNNAKDIKSEEERLWRAATRKDNIKDADKAAQDYIRSLERMNSEHSRGTGLVSQLGQEIAAAYSVSQIRQFLTNIVQIGGQFEYQRKAIAQILDDTGKANALFGQIKNMALKSPFNTLQLDQYAKELSSFDVQYNELFPKLKKIADISAGVGADMSRLINAYGHVMASGYLEGMQRRQFTNANLNIVDPLAKMYTQREGINVSKKDVYARISEKRVTAEDLDRVLMAMAEPGGQFYNMQESMADTTKAVWKNLGDAINHMYMDLESNFGGVFKAVGLGLTDLTKNVAKYSSALVHLGTAYAMVRGWQAMSIKLSQSEFMSLVQSGRALNAKKARHLEVFRSYNLLSKAEKDAIARGAELTATQFKYIVDSQKVVATDTQRETALARLVMLERELGVSTMKNVAEMDLKILAEKEAAVTAGLLTKEEQGVVAAAIAEGKVNQSQVVAIQQNAAARFQKLKLMYEESIAGYNIAKEEILRASVMGKLTKAEEAYFISLGMVTQAEIANVHWTERAVAAHGFWHVVLRGLYNAIKAPFVAIGNFGKKVWTVTTTASFSFAGMVAKIKASFTSMGIAIARGADMIKFAFEKAKLAVRSFFASLGPMLLMFAGMEVVFRIYDKIAHWGELSENVKQRNEAASESFRSLAESLREVKTALDGLEHGFSNLDPLQLEGLIKDMSTSLKDNNPFAAPIIAEIFKSAKDDNGNSYFLKPEVERAELLKKALDDAKKIKESLYNGDNEVWGDTKGTLWDNWFRNAGLKGGKSLTSNLKQLQRSYGNRNNAEIEMVRQSDRLVRLLDKIKDKNFRKSVDEENAGMERQVELLRDNFNARMELQKLMDDSSNAVNERDKEQIATWEEANSKARKNEERAIEHLENWAKVYAKNNGFDLSNLRGKSASNVDVQRFMNGMFANLTVGDDALEEEFAKKIIAKFMEKKFKVKVDIEPPSEKALEGWKRAMLSQLENGGKNYRATIEAAPDLLSARNAAVSLYKEAKEKLMELGSFVMGTNFKINMSTSGLAAQMVQLKGKIAAAEAERISKKAIGALTGKGMEDLDNLEYKIQGLRQMYTYFETIYEGFKAFENTPGGKASWQHKEPKKKKHKDKETKDKQLQEWRNQYKAVQQLVEAYKKWNAVMDKTQALQKLLESEEFQTVQKSGALPKDFDPNKLKDPKYFQTYISELQKVVAAAVGSGDKEGRVELANELVNAITGFTTEDLNAAIQIKIKQLDDEMAAAKANVDLYKKALGVTYDDAFSRRISEYSEIENMYDEIANIERRFNKYASDVKDTASKNGEAYTYEDLKDEKIRAQLKDTNNGLVSEWEKAYKEILEYQRKLRENYLSILEDVATATQKVQMIHSKNEDKRQTVAMALRNGIIGKEEADDVLGKMNVAEQNEMWKASEQYARLMDESVLKTLDEVSDGAVMARKHLREMYSSGLITQTEYIKGLKQIDDLMKKARESGKTGLFGNTKWSKSNFGGKVNKLLFGESAKAKAAREKLLYDNSGNADLGIYLGANTSREARKLAYERLKDTDPELAKAARETYRQQRKEEVNDAFGKLTEKAQKLAKVFGDIGGAFGDLKETFEKYGNEDAAFKMGQVQTVANGLQGAMDGLSSINLLNPVSWLTGVVKVFTSIANIFADLHDNKINHEMEKLKRELAETEKEAKSIERTISRGFGLQSGEYQNQLDNLKKQREIQQELLEKEKEKKNADVDAMREMESIIDDLDDKISYYVSDLYRELFGIDFKGWAKTLGDAIWQAFESGNDAAIAWEQAVGDIIRDVAKQFVTLKFIEPEMQKLAAKYVGDDEHDGMWETTADIEGTLGMLAYDIQKVYATANTAIGMVNDYVNDIVPFSSNNNSSSGLSKIGQSMTEETGSIVASYMNSIHYDTSAMRTIAGSQEKYLKTIATETTAISGLLAKLTERSGSVALNVRSVV